jgi:hypothetical protein
VLERALAAEFITEETNWVSLRPRYRDLMRWTAAHLSVQGTAQRQQTFNQELRRALAGASPLSALDAADILSEFVANQTVETRRLESRVVGGNARGVRCCRETNRRATAKHSQANYPSCARRAAGVTRCLI